jgi:flagellar assembly protein FliH
MSFKREELQTPENTPNGAQPSSGEGSSDKQNHNIKSIKLPPKAEMRTIDPPDLRRGGGINYTEIRKRFITGDQASSRFVLNELSRKLMSVEEEDNRRIEAEVQRRMKIIFENLHKKVEEQAQVEGYAAGKEEGRKDMLNELAPSFQQFDVLLKTLDEAAKDIYTANEDFIFRILSQIAKKILIKEIAVDQDYVRRAAIAILERIGTKDNIKIFVNPALLVESEKIKEGMAQSLGILRNLTIEADANIRGGCRIETEFGAVDSTIDTQLTSLEQTLKNSEGS